MTQAEASGGEVVSLSLHRFERPAGRLWGLGQMAWAHAPLRRVPEISFYKLLGAGRGAGFDPRPNFAVWAVLATWPSVEIARRRLAEEAVFARFRARADESWRVLLAPTRSRGAWSGAAPFAPAAQVPPAGAPIAVLTRAALRLRGLGRFWKRVPSISDAIGDQDAALMKLGLGEAPYVNQVTFSIWPDETAIQDFAHRDGPHRAAVEAAWREGWFREQLFARFAVLESAGAWGGADPLRAAPIAA